MCWGVTKRVQVAQSPLASLRALWLSPARSPGLECLVPAGALPPLPRLLPLHFSLSPPPSLPPSPLPYDSVGSSKATRFIYLFSGLAGGGCAARRRRLGGARTPGLNIGRAGCGGGAAPRGRERTLQHYSPPCHTPQKKGRELPTSLPRGERARRGAARRGAGFSATLRTRTADCAPWGGGSVRGGAGMLRGGGSGRACLHLQPSGEAGKPLARRRGAAQAEETKIPGPGCS